MHGIHNRRISGGYAKYATVSYILHMWIPRAAEPRLQRSAKTRPVVVLTGARQTGKTSNFLGLFANGHWTLPNLTAAYTALDRVGALVFPANHSRPLKEAQRLRAEQFAANGDVLGRIVEYVKGRISEDATDEVAFSLADPPSFTGNPEMRPILEEACLFCWEAYRKLLV